MRKAVLIFALLTIFAIAMPARAEYPTTTGAPECTFATKNLSWTNSQGLWRCIQMYIPWSGQYTYNWFLYPSSTQKNTYGPVYSNSSFGWLCSRRSQTRTVPPPADTSIPTLPRNQAPLAAQTTIPSPQASYAFFSTGNDIAQDLGPPVQIVDMCTTRRRPWCFRRPPIMARRLIVGRAATGTTPEDGFMKPAAGEGDTSRALRWLYRLEEIRS